MTLCSHCFPSKKWNKDELLRPLLDNHDMFWIGYLCCDPKPRSHGRQDKYDLFVDELNRMNFSGLRVLFNHNKHRKPLGEVKLTWHNHNYGAGPFAVGFLAVIDNPILKNTKACVTLVEDTFASLSTLESDRTKAIELSITYCGARDGCTGVFVSKHRVGSVIDQYGFPSPHYYKWQSGSEICASYQNQMASETLSAEDVLKQLPEEQYNVLRCYLEQQKGDLCEVVSKMENSNKRYQDLESVLGHYNDYVTSMIQTRLMLEQNNNSDLAIKRRAGFDDLKKMGLLDSDCSNLEASKKLIDYCRECFSDSPESAYLERFWQTFSERFPDLVNQLPNERNTVTTIDAAFNLISKKIRDKDINRLVKENEHVKKRAMEVAETAYNKIDTQRMKCSTNDADQSPNEKKMSFKRFVTDLGLHDDSSNESSPPPKKKAKASQPDDDDDDSKEFLEYAMKRENEYRDLQKRYKSYSKEYRRHKQMRQEERNKRFEDLMKSIPTLTRMVERFEEQEAVTTTRKAEKSQDNETVKESNPISQKTETTKSPEERSIDASAMHTGEEKLWKL